MRFTVGNWISRRELTPTVTKAAIITTTNTMKTIVSQICGCP